MDIDDKNTSSSGASNSNRPPLIQQPPPPPSTASLHSPPIGSTTVIPPTTSTPSTATASEAILSAYAAAAASGTPLSYNPYISTAAGQFPNPYVDFSLFNRNAVSAAAAVAAAGYYNAARAAGVVGVPPAVAPFPHTNFNQVIIQPEVSKMWVGNLPQDTTEEELRVFFSPYGKIESIKVDYRCAFIKYTEHILAQNAIKATNGVLFKGNKIKVNWASMKLRGGKLPQPSATSPLLFTPVPPLAPAALAAVAAASSTTPLLAGATTPTSGALASTQSPPTAPGLLDPLQIVSPPLSSASNSIKTTGALSSSNNSLNIHHPHTISPPPPPPASSSSSISSVISTASSSSSSSTSTSSTVQLPLDLKDISKHNNSNSNNNSNGLNSSSGRINNSINSNSQHYHPYHRPPQQLPLQPPTQASTTTNSTPPASAHQVLHYNDFEDHVLSNKSKTLSTSPYDKLLLEEKNHLLYLIDHLTTTYRSIKEAKDWILLHFRCYRSIISIISSYFQEVSLNQPPPPPLQQQQQQTSTTRVLQLLYLVSDLLHFGLIRRRSIDQLDIIAELTEPHLSTMFVTFHDEPTQNQNQAMLILDLWESKKIYPPKIVQSLKQLI